MKNISIIILIAIFSFQGVAQEKINWLTTSEFEKAVQKENQNFFIFLEEDRKFENVPDERKEVMKQRMFRFLENEELIKYLNKNFLCYKFNSTASKRINFQGIEYKEVEERGRTYHEFINYLTDSDRSRLPAIVLRDQNFNLFEYHKSIPPTEEIKVLLEAEKLKSNYIIEKLGADHQMSKRSISMIENQSGRLQKAQENNKDKSVLSARNSSDRLLRILTYFVSESYQKTDMEGFMKETRK